MAQEQSNQSTFWRQK